MTKLAQDSYSQGVLDFFKTASVDPAIREAAVGMLVKEGEMRGGELTPQQLNPFGVTSPQHPLNYNRDPSILMGQTPRKYHQRLYSQASAAERLKLDPRILDDVIQAEMDSARNLESNYLKQRELYRQSQQEVAEVRRAAAEAEKELRQQLRVAQNQAQGSSGAVSRLNQDVTRLQQELAASQAAQESAATANASRVSQLEADLAKRTQEAEKLTGNLDRAKTYRGQQSTLINNLRQDLEFNRASRETAEEASRGLAKRLSRAKGLNFGLGGLAALGLGYMGYDQLSGR